MNRELPASASRPEHTGDTETPHPNPHLGRRLTERPDPARMRVGVGSADTNGLTWLLDLAVHCNHLRELKSGSLSQRIWLDSLVWGCYLDF